MSRVILCFLVFSLFLLPTAPGSDWPQYLGPNRNNVSSETGLVANFPETGPKVLWEMSLTTAHGAASVRDGLVYILDSKRVVKKAEKEGEKNEITRYEVLHCLVLATGYKVWSLEFPEQGKGLRMPGPRSAPAVSEKFIVITGQYGEVHCIDRQTRKIVWQANLIKDFEGKVPMLWGVCQSPQLYKDTVILMPAGKKAGLVAYEMATGKIVWKTISIGKMNLSSPVLATIGGIDQILAIGAPSEEGALVVGVEAATGKMLWSHSGWGNSSVIPSPTYIGAGRILLTSKWGSGTALIKVAKVDDKFTTSTIFAVNGVRDPKNKDKNKWIMLKPTYASNLHQPIFIDDHFFFVSQDNDNTEGMLCMDMTGKVLWNTGRKPNIWHGNFLYADGRLYLHGKDNFLRIVKPDITGYKELAAAKVGIRGYNWAPLTLSDGKLLVRSGARTGVLTCLDIKAKP